jgi:hypothetical protein
LNRSIDLTHDKFKAQSFSKNNYNSVKNKNFEGQKSTEYLTDKFIRQDFRNSEALDGKSPESSVFNNGAI